MTSDNATTDSPLRQTLRLLRPHLAGSRGLSLAGIAALLAEVAARLLEPWPVQWVIDAVIPAALGTGVVDAGLTRLLVTAAVAVLAVGAMRAGASYLATVAFANVGARVTTSLRADLHRRLLDARHGFHEQVRSGDLVTRVVSDVGRVQEAAVTAGLPLVGNVITVVGMLVVVTVLDPLLGLVVAAVLPLMAWSSRRTGGRITSASRVQRRREGQLAGDAGEAFAAVRTVQAYQLANQLSGRFESANVKGLKDGVKAKRLSAGLERRTDLIVALTTGLVLAVGGSRVVAGAISPGELVVFLTYLKTTFKPLRDVAKHTGRISRAAASGERIAATFRHAQPETDASWARPLPPPGPGRRAGRVEFHDVRTGYQRDLPVLRGASLVVRPGERVALVGASGSGKSTVVNLLLGFLDPWTGSVRLDGHDVSDLTRSSVRQAIAVVLQDSTVFAGTLADNVRLGNPQADDEQITWALEQAQLGDLIAAHPDGIGQAVSERGSTLSGGQRQRVAVARALLRNPHLVLLDEPTTGLDGAAARAVLEALTRLATGRTTLMITHDPDLLGLVDRVVEVRDGRFVERADLLRPTTTADLRQRTGVYDAR